MSFKSLETENADLSAPFVKTTCFQRHDFLNKKKLVILGIKENVFLNTLMFKY